VLIFAAGNWRTWVYSLAPLDVPLPASAGEYAYRFTAGFAAEYELQIVAERRLAPEVLDCLLFTRTLWHRVCSGRQDALRAVWEISERNRLIGKGSSEESGSIGLSQNSNRGTPEGEREATVVIRRGMGMIRAKGSHAYNLKITMLTDNSQLLPANPRLQVQMYLADRERISATAHMSLLVATLAWIAGLVLISTDLVHNGIRRRFHRIAVWGTSLYGAIVTLIIGYNCVAWMLVSYYPGDYDIDVGFSGKNLERFVLLILLLVIPAVISVFIVLSRFLRLPPEPQASK
jgi:hypothetical protein